MFKKILRFIKKRRAELVRYLYRLVYGEKVGVHGTIRLIGKNFNDTGKLELVFDKTFDNLITDAGFDLIANTLGLNAQPSDITHMAIGSGAVGGTGDTTLTSEDNRQTAVFAHTGGTKTFTFTATFASVVAATEYGCFNAAAAGSMFNTAGFTAITVDSLEIVCTVTLS